MRPPETPPPARWTCSPDRLSHAVAECTAPPTVRTLCGAVFHATEPLESGPVMHTAMCTNCAELVVRTAVGLPLLHSWPTPETDADMTYPTTPTGRYRR